MYILGHGNIFMCSSHKMNQIFLYTINHLRIGYQYPRGIVTDREDFRVDKSTSAARFSLSANPHSRNI